MKKFIVYCLLLFSPVFIHSVFGQTASVEMLPVQERRALQKYRQEIKTIADRAAVKEAFKIIRDLEPLTRRDLILLTEIAAPPFMETQRAKKYAEILRSAGADSVWIDEAGNVIARRKGRAGGRTVALDAHMDTVFPEGTDVTVKFHGDTLLAPGIGDDTRGMVIVLAVLRAMEAAHIETESDLLFIGTVGEEGLGDLRGVKHLFSDSGPGINSWISVDGGGMSRIVHRALGSRRYRITFRGPGGHSWGAFGLANPHHALGSAIHYFVESADTFTAQGARTSYNIGRIGGGTSINSIPYEAWMEVDMRSENPGRLTGIDELLHKAVKRAFDEQNKMRRHGPELTVEVEMVGDRPSGALDINLPVIQRAIAAAHYFGIDPELGTGSTNSNIPISRGIPAITIGRGGVGGATHSIGEWWLNKDGYLAIQNVLLILLAEAGIIN